MGGRMSRAAEPANCGSDRFADWFGQRAGQGPQPGAGPFGWRCTSRRPSAPPRCSLLRLEAPGPHPARRGRVQLHRPARGPRWDRRGGRFYGELQVTETFAFAASSTCAPSARPSTPSPTPGASGCPVGTASGRWPSRSSRRTYRSRTASSPCRWVRATPSAEQCAAAVTSELAPTHLGHPASRRRKGSRRRGTAPAGSGPRPPRRPCPPRGSVRRSRSSRSAGCSRGRSGSAIARARRRLSFLVVGRVADGVRTPRDEELHRDDLAILVDDVLELAEGRLELVGLGVGDRRGVGLEEDIVMGDVQEPGRVGEPRPGARAVSLTSSSTTSPGSPTRGTTTCPDRRSAGRRSGRGWPSALHTR